MLILLPNAIGDAATNMAIDASLLYTLPKGIAAFRHYGWIEPAITFGYTQRIAEIKATFPEDLRLCRRLTGGGIVDHRNDWTYALAIQTDLPAAHTPATELYTIIHRSIQQALEKQSIPSQLAPCPRACGQQPTTASAGPDQCFMQPTTDDVLTPSGQKIAGAAMKRAREGLLMQGSIDRATLPDTFDYTRFADTFQQFLTEDLDIPIGTTEDLRTLFDSPRIQEERQRFGSDVWMNRR
jgi:lipoate-protein ligase A